MSFTITSVTCCSILWLTLSQSEIALRNRGSVHNSTKFSIRNTSKGTWLNVVIIKRGACVATSGGLLLKSTSQALDLMMFLLWDVGLPESCFYVRDELEAKSPAEGS